MRNRPLNVGSERRQTDGVSVWHVVAVATSLNGWLV